LTPETARHRKGLLLLFLALAAYSVFLAQHCVLSVGGSDSSAYANTARRLLAGQLVFRPRSLEELRLPDALAPIFTPLGFLQGSQPGTLAPVYPVGFPAHVAAAALLGGWQRGPYVVSPVAAVVCLALVFLLGRELGLHPAPAAAVAIVLAAWPPFLYQAIQPMSDVVATLWATAAILFGLRARRQPAWAAACGAAFGLAVFVRPTCGVLALPLLFALPLRMHPLGLFALGAAPFAGTLAMVNARCYGGVFRTGYTEIGLLDQIALSNFTPRIRYYGQWLFRTLTPVVPLAAAAAAAVRSRPLRDRFLLLSWFAVFLGLHCLYGPYEAFGFLRFLLPGVPGLLLAAALTAQDLLARARWARATAIAASLLLAVILSAESRVTKAVGVLGMAEYESIYPRACEWVASSLPARSAVVATISSGALEYYTRLPYVRWDFISPERWPTFRSAIEARGYRFFALLFPDEEKEFARHVPGEWTKIGSMRDLSLWRLSP